MNCKVCGIKLTGKRTTVCSDKCKNKAARIKMKAEYHYAEHDKVCKLESCNVTFVGKLSKKYCSRICAIRGKAVIARVKAREAREEKVKYTPPKYKDDDSWLGG